MKCKVCGDEWGQNHSCKIEPVEVAEKLDLTDEASQRAFDLASLYENIRVARGDLAATKVQFYLARGGVKGFDHPNQWRDACTTKRSYLDALLRMVSEVEAGGPLPEPTPTPKARREQDLARA